ncbi:hypothetical protein RUND412_011224, partial [Rhizina undulata]
EKGLGKNWMPILANIEDEHGGSYRIRFINRENPEETRWISTENPAIREFKAFLDGHYEVLRKGSAIEKGALIPHEMESAEAIDGLNAAFVVQAMIEWFGPTSHRNGAGGEINSDLAMALKIHSYVNMTQMGHATLTDVAKVLKLVRTALVSEKAVKATLSTFSRTLSRLGSVSEGFGVVLGGVLVGLDIYELVHATNNIERAVFGTQLAFDSASFVAGLGGVGLGFVGASTAAAALGGASVILAGVGIGVGALALQYGQNAESAAAVGRYFADIDDAYERGGYKYDSENKCLIPLPGAVVWRVDLTTGGVDFDSQYIYRTQHGSTGSGKINYFFWAGDFPKMIKDYSQAINVRAGIGKNKHASLVRHDSFTTLILPCTPKSFISYSYMDLPGATTRHDRGFDVIRRLEQDYRFDFDFYIFPMEEIIGKISHEYVKTTPVTVVLDRSIRVQIPTLPTEIQDKMSYTLQGAGGEYTIGLNTGAELTLETIGVSKKKTMWILDARELANDSVEVSDDHVVIAGMTVQLEDHSFRRMLIITRYGETLEVDFTNHTATPIAEDASQWPGSSESLIDHLRSLAKGHLSHGKFIVINNYSIPSGNSTSRGVGRAFYDVDHDRMLYTDDASDSLTHNAELGAVVGNEVYFYNDEYGCLWRVEAGTGKCLAKYTSFYETKKSKVARVWENEKIVMVAYRHALGKDMEGKDEEGELVYAVESEKMTLVSIVGHHELLQRLSRTDRIEGGIKQLLSAYDSDAMKPPITELPFRGIQVYANTDANIVSVFGTDYDGSKYRYWLRKRDGAVITPDLPGTTIQDDLVFAGSLISDMNGSEVFYFFTRKEKTIYRQTSIGTGAIAVAIPEQFSEIFNLINVDGVLFAITTLGYILRLTAAGSLLLEGVNEHWTCFKYSSWWRDLITAAGENGATTITVLGVKDPAGVPVPMWYHNEGIIVVSHVLYGKQLQVLRLNGDGSEAWLCHWDSSGTGHLYTQRLLPMYELDDMLASGGKLLSPERIPDAQPMLPNHSVAKITGAGDSLQFTMSDGAVITLDEKGSPFLVAVDLSQREANSDDLKGAMKTLAKMWPHSGVVILLGTAEPAPSWYQLAKQQKLTLHAMNWDYRPVWLGTTVNGTAGFIHIQSLGSLYRVERNLQTKIGDFALARCYGKSLVLAHAIDSKISIPTLANIENVMVSGGKGHHTYHISVENWDHYKSFTIENRNKTTGRMLDRLIIGIGYLGKFTARNVNDDLVLLDETAGKSLTIRKAFGRDQAYRGLQIITTSGPLTIEDFEKTQLVMRNELKIDTMPKVTVGFVIYSKQNNFASV